MPTTGTKLYVYRNHAWIPVYAELFVDAQKQAIFTAFDASLKATGFVPEQVWGERIEDRGSQITFSALGQQAPIHAKEVWRSEEHTSELQSLMRISYAVFCLKKKTLHNK